MHLKLSDTLLYGCDSLPIKQIPSSSSDVTSATIDSAIAYGLNNNFIAAVVRVRKVLAFSNMKLVFMVDQGPYRTGNHSLAGCNNIFHIF